MKKLLGFLTVLFFITACSKDDRVSGVCNSNSQMVKSKNMTWQI